MSLTLQEFRNTLSGNKPPVGLSVHLEALWYDAKGDWHTAHHLIDQFNDRVSARVHAYLHREEGDLWNAQYWYSKAKEKMPEESLEKEWEQLFHRLAK